MSSHAGLKLTAPWPEALARVFTLPGYIAYKLTHGVAVVVERPKGVFHGIPPGRKYRKVNSITSK